MYSLILLNGGIGSRIGANQPKQLLKLRGIPILVYALVTADRVEQISQIVLNYPPEGGWREQIEEVLEAYAISTPVVLVEAGDSRHSSVQKMIEHCTNDDVIIHETARPLVRTSDFQRLIDSEHANVSLMSEISFTVAPVDPPETSRVTGSLERSRLRNVQLPPEVRQVRPRGVACAGHRAGGARLHRGRHPGRRQRLPPRPLHHRVGRELQGHHQHGSADGRLPPASRGGRR